jgi:hypothetical protein
MPCEALNVKITSPFALAWLVITGIQVTGGAMFVVVSKA